MTAQQGALDDQQVAASARSCQHGVLEQRGAPRKRPRSAREAEAAYHRAIALDPDAPEPLANYGARLLNSTRNEEAKAMIEKALAVPEHAGRIGLNYVSPQRVNFFISETYLGERLSYPSSFSSPLVAEQDDAFVTDIGASRESGNRHFSASPMLFNVFDADVDVGPLVSRQGRTLRATISSRF